MNFLIIWWILGLLQVKVEATEQYLNVENYSSTFTSRNPVYYFADNDYIGKQISFYFTARARVLFLEALYIHLGPRSCEKVKVYSQGEPTFGLGCTDSGIRMFYNGNEQIGGEFSFEITDLKLEKGEVFYVRVSAGSYDMSVSCQGYQITDKRYSSNPTNREINGKNCKEGDETNLYIIFGGILAAVIVINIVCIGVYCYISCSGQSRCKVQLQTSKEIYIHIPATCEPEAGGLHCQSNQERTTKRLTTPSTTNGETTLYTSTEATESSKTISAARTTNRETSPDITTVVTQTSTIITTTSTTSGSSTDNNQTSTGVTESSKTISAARTTNRETSPDITTVVTQTPTIITTTSTTSGSSTDNNQLSTGVTENSKVDKEGDEINPYIMFGGILAALIVIITVCIGVYCFLRNRKRPQETPTNVALSNWKENENDNSHYHNLDIHDTEITDDHTYEELPATNTIVNEVHK
ncbi:hypothetical protein LOTGIDRAFT_233204 [Lottia gigantea]|uniref:CUB domain-containing protein n=1 Tax=Lottia gigantea TaxID=225164 RepID=V4A5X9_LOTGI|nr:hypothetical protein LOTGIDRAFT_233204 [Lottia gigantea]ESO92127.1 hypothetical protein LOTGIDRAFT_233204 [Lottia gigantea]